jgi:hypothetical protein
MYWIDRFNLMAITLVVISQGIVNIRMIKRTHRLAKRIEGLDGKLAALYTMLGHAFVRDWDES